jgi:peptidyl-prolyl cis-trans isomerase D
MAHKTEQKKVQHTGIMNKMRDKMPIIIIALIVCFLAMIVFEWGMNFLGMNNQNFVFAKINGQEIKYEQFNQMVENQAQQMIQQNNGKNLDDAQYQQLRDQVWQSLVQQTLVQQEIQKLGITVSDSEILDWIYQSPQTLPDPIKQSFMDSTGNFNIASYQQALAMKSKEATQFWNQVENYLRELILSRKLQAAVTGSILVPESDVIQKYNEANKKMSFQYALFDLNSITDTNLYAVSEEEMRKYYEDNKDEFKQEAAIKLRYAVFNDNPTPEDSATTKKMLGALIKDFKTVAEADSALIKFVNISSQTPYNNEFQKPNAISKGALNFLFSAQPGNVSEVIIDQDGYKVVRLLESKTSEDTYVKASHILINFGTDTAAAKKKADEILARIKAGENINTLAQQLSEDPSAKTNGGDLGWFGKGAMVKEFEEAAFNNPAGSLVGPVKTSFGFHIIKVEDKANKEFRFAELKETVKAGARTRDNAKKSAIDFVKLVDDGANFDTLAKNMKLTVAVTPEITEEGFIPLAGQNKSLINWAFDNKVGKVHSPIKVTGGFGVYQIAEKISEGYKNYDSVKTALIKPKLVFEKKIAVLMAQANNLKPQIQNNDLNTLKALDPKIQVDRVDSMTVSAPNPKIGNDPALNNVLLSMNDGQLSNPVKTQRGVFLIYMMNSTPFDQSDYDLKSPDIRRQLITEKQQSLIQEWIAELQNKADIEDNRDMYF